MPHKHVRRKGGDGSHFNLAPSVAARPLPTRSNSTKPKKKKPGRSTAREDNGEQNGYKYDDTPRAFARMMDLHTSNKRQRSGLDDGNAQAAKKKQKTSSSASSKPVQDVTGTQKPQGELPKILPGERLGDFAARVDQAMPVGGLARKGNVKIEGIKPRQTKTEKRLHKMYAAWRVEDARRKDKLEEEKEMKEEEEAEMDGPTVTFEPMSKKKRRRGEDDDDPWAELKAKRSERKGLHDVVQAPPDFRVVPKEKFKIKRGATVDVENIPTAAGSLKRREELSEARKEVIERYRAMMGKG